MGWTRHGDYWIAAETYPDRAACIAGMEAAIARYGAHLLFTWGMIWDVVARAHRYIVLCTTDPTAGGNPE